MLPISSGRAANQAPARRHAIVGPFSLIYVPKKLIVTGNATATANNVLAHETLFRLGIAADLIGLVMFILVVMALYRLLRGVNETQASHMAALGLVSAAVGFLNVLNHSGTPLECCSFGFMDRES